MMKAPTTIAITANAIRKMEMTSRNWPIWSWVSSTTLSPVTAVKPSGATARGSGGELAPGRHRRRAVRETLVKASAPFEEDLLGLLGVEQDEGRAGRAAAVELGGADEGERASRVLVRSARSS